MSLIFVRILLAPIADRLHRSRLIPAYFVRYEAMLLLTSGLAMPWQWAFRGIFFGLLRRFAHPAMTAQMMDRSRQRDREIFVDMLTGSFGVGISVPVLAWGFIADLRGDGLGHGAAGVTTVLSTLVAALALLNIEEDDTDTHRKTLPRDPSSLLL